MESVWTEVKSAIKKQIPCQSFMMWIDPIEFSRSDDGRIVLSCPNFFSKKRIENQYSPVIEEEIKKIYGSSVELVFEVFTRPSEPKKSVQRRTPSTSSQILLPNIGNPVMQSGRMLRDNYTFDEFVVGSCNDFAYSAALSLAMGRHTGNSSLLLMSGTGMGKSHLSQAIGHYIARKKTSEKVYYITAEDFTNEMIGSLKSDTSQQFKEKYRTKCDVLLLEDIQFLSGKERTQAELAMTLDHLFESGKKIMFSSSCLPSDIPKLSDHLKSRFSSSIISHIESPDFKTRVRILKKKAARENCRIPDQIIEYLAGELTGDVRQLESGLVGVIARSSLLGVPIDMELAENVVKNIAVQKKIITIDLIKDVVSREFGITVGEMISKSRKQHVVKPRQVAIYLSRKYTDQTLQAIGRSFNRYHATAMHAVGCIEKSMREEAETRKQIDYISKKLKKETVK